MPRIERQVHVGGARRGDRARESRLETRVDAVEGDERALVGRRQRRRHGVRLAGTAKVDHPHTFGAQPAGGAIREPARKRHAKAEPGGGDGRNGRAAADGRRERVGADFLAGGGQPVESHEHEVLEGLSGRQKVWHRHAGL